MFFKTFADLHLVPVLVKAILDVQLCSYHAHPGPAEAFTNCKLFCSSKQVAQEQSQAVSDFGLHSSPS